MIIVGATVDEVMMKLAQYDTEYPRPDIRLLVPPGESANEKYNESHDPTTNYGAW